MNHTNAYGNGSSKGNRPEKTVSLSGTGKFVVWTESIKKKAEEVRKIIEKREEIERKEHEREFVLGKR